LSDFDAAIIAEFRAHGGRVGGPFEGVPVLLLSTRGAKTGEPRTTPVVYGRDGERIVIFASKAGAPSHPAWYHNLLANPTATVEVGTERFEVDVEETVGEERDRLFAAQAARQPQFDEYAARTTRVIPVLALGRRA
jgi:deazaflavin-dependent oxidoreductase (nitroreductase family)